MAEQATHGRRRRWARICVAVLVPCALVFAGVYWWLDSGRRMFIPRRWGVVEEGRIYRSGLIYRGLIEDTLREHRIATVVDLSALGPDDPDVAAERDAARRLGIRTLDVRGLVGDGTGDDDAYLTALTEMARAVAGKPVLVHCAGGSERTGAAVALYRMLLEGWDGARAWDEYRSFRRKPPNDDDLARYVNEHLGALAQRLVEAGVIERVPSPLPRFGPPRPGD